MDITGFIIFLVIGGVAGWLAGTIMKGGGFGLLGNILIGIAGGIVGGFLFRLLVIAASLGAMDAARTIEGYPADQIPTLHYGKGVYFRLAGPPPFRGLVYPLPEPGALGTHYTRDLAGQGRFGPDLEFATSESYDVDPAKAVLFEQSIRRYWPGLPKDALEPAYAGIRPKIHGPGEAQPDFRIDGPERHRLPGLVTLFGIESPGLTCSLALAEAVADLLDLPGKSPL